MTAHLLLLESGFGTLIGGKHSTLIEEIKKVLQHATVHHAMVQVNDFYELEQLRVECNPRCGSCKCGQCHPGGKHMTLKEEREYKIIEDKLVYKADQKKWEGGYLWIKDPRTLPDNKSAAFTTPESHRETSQYRPKTCRSVTQEDCKYG